MSRLAQCATTGRNHDEHHILLRTAVVACNPDQISCKPLRTDVNKRVSRLAANISLIQHNLCPLSFVDVSQNLYISAMLGVYELQRIELLRDLFVWAYQRSCARYSAGRQSLGEPDLFRLQHRQAIGEVVAAVVRERLNKAQAIAHIHQFARQSVAPSEQHKFIETVETQLLSLHEGSIARYRLRPGEFHAWQQSWC